jgi:hypothetical protein
MNSWLFPVKDACSGKRKITALDIFRTRMNDGFWGLGENVKNSQRICENDPVIFYLAGKDGKSSFSSFYSFHFIKFP